MPRTRKPIPEPEPEPAYDVEFIRKARVTEDQVWEYYIKWGGYPEEENSWEPEENLSGCKRMLRDFWEQIGSGLKPKSKIFPLDFEVAPSAVWIEKQRKTYSKTAARKARLKELGADDDDEEEETREDEEDEEEMRPTSARVSRKSQEDADSDADDIPLSMKVNRRQADESSSDDTPLASETNSRRKRKRKEGRGSDDGKKRRRMEHKRLDVIVIPDSPVIGSQVSRKSRNSSPSTSTSGSLFGGSEPDSDTPLASKLSTSLVPAPSSHKPTEPPPNKTLTGPSASLNASTSVKPMPAHLQRKLNPRVKPMALPIPRTGGPLGISTKARISTGNMGPRSAEALSPASPSVGNPFSSFTSNSVASELPKSIPQPSTPTEFDATRWLQENIVSTETSNNSSALPSTTNTTQSLHFSKRWRWTGQLAVGDNESEDAFAEPVGAIVLTDNTPLDQTISELGIQQLIPSHVDSLCLRHSHPLAMLPAVMADFKISQFARMSVNQTDGENSFSHVVAYMTKHELYSQTPLYMGDRIVATMFVFPACFEYLWDQLCVPPKARQGHDLLVAVGFQVYEPIRGCLGGPVKTYSMDWKSSVKPETVPESSDLDCSRALQTLTFPDILYKRIAHKECALFTTFVDKGMESPDTLALITVFNSAPGCKIVPILTGSARFIFIHVSAWDILHKLIGLVDRRRRRQDVQFYTYGSDPIVESKHWGVHEVFPVGGVVTFTPRAIAEDPEGVEKLISKLDEHPLWACYVLPSVVAVIIDVVKSDNGPNSKLKGAVDALCGILMPIEKGQIALTWQPPPSRAWHKEYVNDTDLTPKCISWMIDQGRLSDLRGHDLVLECQKRLQQSPDRSERDVELRIVKDMLVMQSELRRVYRRFVIITDSTGASNASREAAANITASKADIKDGFEFMHLNQFVFGDDYAFADS